MILLMGLVLIQTLEDAVRTYINEKRHMYIYISSSFLHLRTTFTPLVWMEFDIPVPMLISRLIC